MASHVRAVQNQRYIPWHSQMSELLKSYPEATWEVHENDVGDPFFVSTMGVMVKVSVTIEELTRTINYPVLNSYNKSLKVEPYSYTTKKGEIKVPACTTFDINSAIMRAFTKCVATHGQGLHVYKDEMHSEPELLDSAQLQTVITKIKEKNLVLSQVCAAWQIEKIAQLHAVNFENMINWVEAQ